MINQKGSAYVLVLAVIGFVSIMVCVSLYFSKMQFNISLAYQKTGNLYELAQSGAENAAYIITQIVEANKDIAKTSTVNYIRNGSADPTYSIESRLQYGLLNVRAECYEKKFYLIDNNAALEPNKMYQRAYYQNLNKLVRESLKQHMTLDASNLSTTIDVYNLHHSINSSGKDVNIDVSVTVRNSVTYEEIKDYVIVSTATDKETGNIIKYQFIISTQLPQTHEEILFEEYMWRSRVSEDFRYALLLKGDLLLENSSVHIGYEKDTAEAGRHSVLIEGSVPTDGIFEGDEFGGIKVTDGSKLRVNGNVYTNAAIQTKRKFNAGSLAEEEAEIYINGDVIAQNVSIEDNHYRNGLFFNKSLEISNKQPEDISTQPNNHNITISGDAYLYNSLFINKYCRNSNIKILGDVYLIGASKTTSNDSGAVYNKGANSLIEINGRLFVNGVNFLTYDKDGELKQIALHESVGVPYEPLEYLDRSDAFTEDGSYYKKSEIDCDKIILGKETGYSTGYVSANGKSYTSAQMLLRTFEKKWRISSIDRKIISSPSDADYFFNLGLKNNKEYFNTKNSPNVTGVTILPLTNSTNYRGRSDIAPILELLGEINVKWTERMPNQQYNVNDYIYNSGLRGYMNELCRLPDLEYGIGITLSEQDWSISSPLIYTNHEEIIDISKFYNGDDCVPTIIIMENSSQTFSLIASDKSKNNFKGLIISNGKIQIKNSTMDIEGIIISTQAKTKNAANDIENGSSSALHIKDSTVTIKYNPDIFLSVQLDNNALKRKIMDYLNLTNFKSVSPTSVIKLNSSTAILNKLKIKNNSPINIDGLPPVTLQITSQKQIINTLE